MSLATDMGGFPVVGSMPRMDPVKGIDRRFGTVAKQSFRFQTPSVAAGFVTGANASSVVVTQKADRVVVRIPDNSGNISGWVGGMFNTDTAPSNAQYTVDLCAMFTGGQNQSGCGLALRTASDAWLTIVAYMTNNSFEIHCDSWATFNSGITNFTRIETNYDQPLFFRFLYNQGVINHQWAPNGRDFITVRSANDSGQYTQYAMVLFASDTSAIKPGVVASLYNLTHYYGSLGDDV